MTIYTVYVLNKAGGLIYHQEFPVGTRRLPSNEHIFLASMFHGLHAITAKVALTDHSSGIEVMETESFKLSCLQTLTSIKFIVISDNQHQNVGKLLNEIYQLYSDYVLKNPFYSLEMPIRCELFDLHLTKHIENH
eukprot:Nk52_evm15s16 gene=Nk52_evmTU15s16